MLKVSWSEAASYLPMGLIEQQQTWKQLIQDEDSNYNGKGLKVVSASRHELAMEKAT